jgi:hypothetical protein
VRHHEGVPHLCPSNSISLHLPNSCDTHVTQSATHARSLVRELILPIAKYLGVPKDRVFANRMNWQVGPLLPTHTRSVMRLVWL